MLDLAAFLIETREPVAGGHAVAAELNETLHSGICVLAETQLAQGRGRIHAWAPTWLGELGLGALDGVLHETMPSCPLVQHYSNSGDQAPRTVTDVADRVFWERTHAYEVASTQFGAVHELCLPVHNHAGDLRTFVLFRPPKEAFTDRELAYAIRVQPLLIAADRHLRNLQRWRNKTAAAAGEHAISASAVAAERGLTPREVTILHLLGEGLTATAIANRLGIRPATVVKHKENLYRKLETTDRLTTVLCAQELGLLPPKHLTS